MRVEGHLRAFGVAGEELVVGGVPLRRLAARAGSTPFFAYSRDLLTERVASVRQALGDDVRLGYAVKANPMPAVVQHLAARVDWLDVASSGEMAVALDAGQPAARVAFAGPGKTDAELRQAVAAGVLLEVESAGEVDRLAAVGEALGIRPRLAVRVNPDFVVRGSGMRMGGGPQQFGVDAELVPALLDDIADRDLGLEGFHLFAGSQNLQVDIVMEAQARTVDLLLALADKLDAPVGYLNLGGGLGIPYFPKDEPVDLPHVGDHLRELVQRSVRPAQPTADVVVELGRYLVGEAGVYVTRVVDVKVSRGHTYLVVDGGMHHQLAASGNFGQVVRRNFPVVVGTRVGREPAGETSVVGSLCTPLDLLADRVDLPATEPGDLVVVLQAGAYGLTASPTRFLGHPEPVELLV